MRGAIPPPPYVFMAWCLVKRRDNFTLPLTNIFRVFKSSSIRMEGRTCSMHGEDENVHKTLDGKPDKKTLFGGYRCRWADNIKMYLKEILYNFLNKTGSMVT
jgi:hypothetical protein